MIKIYENKQKQRNSPVFDTSVMLIEQRNLTPYELDKNINKLPTFCDHVDIKRQVEIQLTCRKNLRGEIYVSYSP